MELEIHFGFIGFQVVVSIDLGRSLCIFTLVQQGQIHFVQRYVPETLALNTPMGNRNTVVQHHLLVHPGGQIRPWPPSSLAIDFGPSNEKVIVRY